MPFKCDKKITAIKKIRHIYGIGLREAKYTMGYILGGRNLQEREFTVRAWVESRWVDFQLFLEDIIVELKMAGLLYGDDEPENDINKIYAVKGLRLEYGFSLKDAKLIVEHLFFGIKSETSDALIEKLMRREHADNEEQLAAKIEAKLRHRDCWKANGTLTRGRIEPDFVAHVVRREGLKPGNKEAVESGATFGENDMTY